MKRVLCLQFPNWAIQRILAAQPALERKPVVLYESRRGTRYATACSPAAMARGASVGMPVTEVTALADLSLSAGCLLAHDIEADREKLGELAIVCERFSPVVGLPESDMPCDSLVLDISGVAHLFGGEAALAENIVEHFSHEDLSTRIVVAETVGTAWGVTHFDPGRRDHAIDVIPPGCDMAALAPLPIEALRLSQDHLDKLHSLGIVRVEQLAALPRRGLASRFDLHLLKRMDQATGRQLEPILPHRSDSSISASQSLEYPISQGEMIESVVEHLIKKVALQLTDRGLGALRLECRLECTTCGDCATAPFSWSIGLFEPTAFPDHLFELAQVQLERLRLPSPVIAASVTVTATASLAEQQQTMFFEEGSPNPSEGVAELINRLSNRLGRKAVVGIRLLRDAQPELTWRGKPLLDSPRRRVSPAATTTDLPSRPLRLLSPPKALSASSAPQTPPSSFLWERNTQYVARYWGPERIETGWWRHRTVGRDYYQVETMTGHRFWLFRRLHDDHWFVHGIFE